MLEFRWMNPAGIGYTPSHGNLEIKTGGFNFEKNIYIWESQMKFSCKRDHLYLLIFSANELFWNKITSYKKKIKSKFFKIMDKKKKNNDTH